MAVSTDCHERDMVCCGSVCVMHGTGFIKISHAHEIVTSGLKENLYICIHLVMSDLLKQ